MSEEPHVDLGGYLLGWLMQDELVAFEKHLAACAQCQEELHQLEALPSLLALASPTFELPSDLWAKTLAAVARAEGEATGERAAAPRPRWQGRWRVVRGGTFALAGAAAMATAFVVGTQYEARDRGPLELHSTLSAPGAPSVQGQARVIKTGIGRVVEFRTDELPILPKGKFYELWFVGPGDTLADPNRISAGTFHPDEDGRSRVTFAAAVDPARYPILSVTAEPGDGDPQRTGPEVLRSESART